jgi:DNA-binding transcriptional regulator/RsmH inhibitor MraZ
MSSYIKRIYYHTRLNFLNREEKRVITKNTSRACALAINLLNNTNTNKIVCGSVNMCMADVYERVLIPSRIPRKKTLEKNMFQLVKLNGWHDQNWGIQLLRDDETVHNLKR